MLLCYVTWCSFVFVCLFRKTFLFWCVSVCYPAILRSMCEAGGGGWRGHYKDGRRCHTGMVFVAMQAFSSTLLSLSWLMLLLQWPFQEVVELLRPKGRDAEWKTDILEFKTWNMCCIISAFTDNWEHIVWLLCLLKFLQLCVVTVQEQPQNKKCPQKVKMGL